MLLASIFEFIIYVFELFFESLGLLPLVLLPPLLNLQALLLLFRLIHLIYLVQVRLVQLVGHRPLLSFNTCFFYTWLSSTGVLWFISNIDRYVRPIASLHTILVPVCAVLTTVDRRYHCRRQLGLVQVAHVPSHLGAAVLRGVVHFVSVWSKQSALGTPVGLRSVHTWVLLDTVVLAANPLVVLHQRLRPIIKILSRHVAVSVPDYWPILKLV